MQFDDFKDGDLVRHGTDRNGVVVSAGVAMIHVKFDNERGEAIFDRGWFETHPNLLTKREQ